MKTVTKNMPSPALCTNLKTLLKTLCVSATTCSARNQHVQNRRKWAYEVKWAKAARKFVTLA